METAWGKSDAAYTVDMTVTATDRRGLLRDIGDALAREKINVTAVRTQTRDDLAFMRFTFDVADAGQLKRALALVRGLKGVIRVARADGRLAERPDGAGEPRAFPGRVPGRAAALQAAPRRSRRGGGLLHHRVADRRAAVHAAVHREAQADAAGAGGAGARAARRSCVSSRDAPPPTCSVSCSARPRSGCSPACWCRRRRCRQSSSAAVSCSSSPGPWLLPPRCTATRCAPAPRGWAWAWAPASPRSWRRGFVRPARHGARRGLRRLPAGADDLRRRIDAGLVFCLAAGVQGALVAAAALMLGKLGWIELAILAAVPLAARLPLPTRWPVWGQAFLASLYTLACGGAAVASVYLANRGWPSWLQ